jgi:hypothetical protein
MHPINLFKRVKVNVSAKLRHKHCERTHQCETSTCIKNVILTDEEPNDPMEVCSVPLCSHRRRFQIQHG